jgi:hypothetical protein
VRGQELLGPAWDEFQQQLVQPVDGLGAGLAQFVATIHQHAHHHQVVVDLNPDQVAVRRATIATECALP